LTSSSVRPEEAVDLPGTSAEIDTVERLSDAEGLADLADLDAEL
jgi:hypothetical protein